MSALTALQRELGELHVQIRRLKSRFRGRDRQALVECGLALTQTEIEVDRLLRRERAMELAPVRLEAEALLRQLKAERRKFFAADDWAGALKVDDALADAEQICLACKVTR